MFHKSSHTLKREEVVWKRPRERDKEEAWEGTGERDGGGSVGGKRDI